MRRSHRQENADMKTDQNLEAKCVDAAQTRLFLERELMSVLWVCTFVNLHTHIHTQTQRHTHTPNPHACRRHSHLRPQ
jgi:acetyl-CoA carboxylase beta subunit